MEKATFLKYVFSLKQRRFCMRTKLVIKETSNSKLRNVCTFVHKSEIPVALSRCLKYLEVNKSSTVNTLFAVQESLSTETLNTYMWKHSVTLLYNCNCYCSLTFSAFIRKLGDKNKIEQSTNNLLLYGPKPFLRKADIYHYI